MDAQNGETSPARLVPHEMNAAENCNAGSTDALGPAVAFLKTLYPQGPWTLQAMDPTGAQSMLGMTFTPGREEEMAAWIETFNGADRCNLYFSINPGTHALQGNAEKFNRTQIRAVHYFQADLDPAKGGDREAERAACLRRLTTERPAAVPEPSVIIDSGNGYWGLWRLAKPLELNGTLEWADEAAGYNRWLAQVLQGDSASTDVSRIARLPGTINYPNAKKRAAGYEAVPAVVVSVSDVSYSHTAFQKAESVARAPKKKLPLPPREALPEVTTELLLDGGLSDDAVVTLMLGYHPNEQKWGAVHSPHCNVARDVRCDYYEEVRLNDEARRVGIDRSEMLWWVMCEMVRAGFDRNTIAAALLVEDWIGTAHIFAQGEPYAYAFRQVDRAIEAAGKEAAETKGDYERKPRPAFKTAGEDGLPIRQSAHNLELALRWMDVEVSYDQFANRVCLKRHGHPLQWGDGVVNDLRIEMGDALYLVPKDYFYDALDHLARKRSFHPIKDYFAGLAWDGRARLDGWLTEYLGVPDSDYVRAVGRIFLIAAVRRIKHPGCKFDEMLILEGEQGLGKSTALAVLATKSEWFCDDIVLNANTKDIMEQVEGKWIVEAAELVGMSARANDQLKRMLGRRSDSARQAYGRLREDRSRHFVIVGTTNRERYLPDPTGGRRFWPVTCTAINLAALERDRDQLWAEAVAAEAAGESIRLAEELWPRAVEAQSERDTREDDPFYELLSAELPVELGDGFIWTDDAWRLVGLHEQGKRTPAHQKRLGEVMSRLGFDRSQKRCAEAGGKKRYIYLRGDDRERELIKQPF